MGVFVWTSSLLCIRRSIRMATCSVRTYTSAVAKYEEQAQWQIQKKALEKKFGTERWQPRKRLSPDALEGLRALHSQDAQKYSTQALAEQFKVSPEAVRRILKSKWRPRDDEQADRQDRWVRRGQRVWEEWMKKGMKAPKKWRSGTRDLDVQLQDNQRDSTKRNRKIRPRESELDAEPILKATRSLSSRIL